MNYLDSIGLNGTLTDITVNKSGMWFRIYETDEFILILECDENQHKERQCFCEQTRMINISQSFGGIPVYFIRWNPDKYKNENNNYNTNELVESLIKSILNKRTLLPKSSLVSALYMFYDGWNGLLNEKYNKLYNKIKRKQLSDFL
jgi:hypothetical protein